MNDYEIAAWRKVVAIQNELNESDCIKLLAKLVRLCGNAVKPTLEERICVLRELGKWKD